MSIDLKTKSFAAQSSSQPLAFFELNRRAPKAHDVLIEIAFCGVCHSDIHQVRNEWGGSIYPMVPGHEIVGRVKQVGSSVSAFKIGDLVGVGCMVDSCRTCENCNRDLEQFCAEGMTGTYNSLERDRKTPTFGGYSSQVTVDERFVLRVPDHLKLEGVAPLLCAGITTYSPLMHWKAGPGKKVGVLGLGGLGHMAVKIGSKLGAEITVLSSSKAKEKDSKRLGAEGFLNMSEPNSFKRLKGYFDLIINTVSASHDLNAYLNLLRTDGTMVLLGIPPEAPSVEVFSLVGGRRSLAGSLIGGIRETQEMLDFCGKHKIEADVEVINIQEINSAYERMLRGDVKYRFSIDIARSFK